MGLLLLILLVLLLLGAVPRSNGWNANWGPGPAGLILTVLLIVLILVAAGVVPHGGFYL